MRGWRVRRAERARERESIDSGATGSNALAARHARRTHAHPDRMAIDPNTTNVLRQAAGSLPAPQSPAYSPVTIRAPIMKLQRVCEEEEEEERCAVGIHPQWPTRREPLPAAPKYRVANQGPRKLERGRWGWA